MGIGLQVYNINNQPYFEGDFPLNTYLGTGCGLTVDTKSSVYRKKFQKGAYLNTYYYQSNKSEKDVSSAFMGCYASDHPKCIALPNNGTDSSIKVLYAFCNDGSPSANSLKTAITSNKISLPSLLVLQNDPTYPYAGS